MTEHQMRVAGGTNFKHPLDEAVCFHRQQRGWEAQQYALKNEVDKKGFPVKPVTVMTLRLVVNCHINNWDRIVFFFCALC